MRDAEPTDDPFAAVEVSIIVPVYNEEPRLDENLRAMLGQQDAPPFEIVYVDDCSTDHSWEKLMSFAARDNRVQVYRFRRRESRGAVVRAGVRLARGRIIAVLGADCTVDPDWLRHSTLLSEEVAVVGFPVFPPPDLEYMHWQYRFEGSGQVADGRTPHGAGALIRKDLLLKVGNFPDSKVGSDTKAFKAILDLGGRIVLLKAPQVRLMQKRSTIVSHLKRHFERGRYAGPEFRRIYSLLIGGIVVLVVSSILLWSVSPLVSFAALLVALGVLANPRRVHYYVRSFRRPRNLAAKIVTFGVIKVLESLSILSGFVTSIVQRRGAKMPTVPDGDLIQTPLEDPKGAD